MLRLQTELLTRLGLLASVDQFSGSHAFCFKLPLDKQHLVDKLSDLHESCDFDFIKLEFLMINERVEGDEYIILAQRKRVMSETKWEENESRSKVSHSDDTMSFYSTFT